MKRRHLARFGSSFSGPLSPSGERARVRGVHPPPGPNRRRVTLTPALPLEGRGRPRPTRQPLLLLICLTLIAPVVSGQEAPPETPPNASRDPAPAEVPGTSVAPPAEVPGTPASTQTAVPGEAFVNANAAYEEGRYARAIALYERLLETGFENGHLHYNLGNAYLRNGELGRAIAAYRRARAFLPRDQDVRANLAFARKSARDAIAPPEPSAVQKTLFFWHHGLSRAELGKIVVVLNVLFWGVLMLRLYRRGSEVLRWTTIALLLLLLTTGTSLALRHFDPRRVAVVVPQEVDVRSGTNEAALVLFKLHAGTEVAVVDRREGALRIALPEAGRGGWIDAEHAELVVE